MSWTRPGSAAGADASRGRELRDFGLILGGMFAAIFGLLLPLLHRHRIPFWPWALALSLAVIALLRPALLEYLYKAWSALGGVLGWINTRIVLTVLFYAVVTPTGLIARALGLLSMQSRGTRGGRSYRVASHEITKSSFERPY